VGNLQGQTTEQENFTWNSNSCLVESKFFSSATIAWNPSSLTPKLQPDNNRCGEIGKVSLPQRIKKSAVVDTEH